MEELKEQANRIIDKTGLTADENGDAVDIKLLGNVLGTLTQADAGLLMYTSKDGYDATGSVEDIQDVILKDLSNQVEMTPVKRETFPHFYNQENGKLLDDPFVKEIHECITSEKLRNAVSKMYAMYEAQQRK